MPITMKKTLIKRLTAGLILAMALPLCSQAQTMSGGTATPAASTVKAGPLQYTYRIGQMGSAVVSRTRLIGPGNSEPIKPYQPGDINPANIQVTAYPNPFTNEIRISFPIKEQAGNPIIQIIDNTGKVAEAQFQYTDDGSKGQAILKADNLGYGKYIIRILTGGCIYAVSAIKM